ncbi:transcriptional regulator [Haladaptatus sp. R4]|uniref:ArsR/SmtB family transcription factor n=1 Tax=Haladaptatus sp. R4 TaxID=1679489 RepID=UPI0007B478E3|nr:helix-turn-helix domain-containing protein [Haladaptatus sp. R4]KZN24666.1 transcriptional regulator [Haladaptatus sp. R4]
MSKEWGPDDIFDVLASETARDILLLSSSTAMSAGQLARECDASKPTVYRRINKLQEYDLLEQRMVIDNGGNHYNTYRTNMDRICFDIRGDEFVVTIRFEEDLIDRFVSAWTKLGQSETGDN